jgi:hypothetical protein
LLLAGVAVTKLLEWATIGLIVGPVAYFAAGLLASALEVLWRPGVATLLIQTWLDREGGFPPEEGGWEQRRKQLPLDDRERHGVWWWGIGKALDWSVILGLAVGVGKLLDRGAMPGIVLVIATRM